MNSNSINLGQRRFPPIYNPDQQYPQEQQSLYPMRQFLETPASAVKSKTIPQYDPTASKKILGMPADRFSALLGTFAQAIAPESFGGKLGAGVVNMSNLLRGERIMQGRQESAAIEARRRTAAEERKKSAEKKGKAPTIRTFRVDDMDVQHSFNYDTRTWEPIPGMKGKKAKEAEAEEKKKPPTVRTFRIGDKDVQHAWDLDAGEWKPIPGMHGKKVAPPAGEKPKEMTFAEKRARKKELRETEVSILNPENLENPAIQTNIDFFNETADKPYVYQRTPGTPAEETGWFDLERDVEAIPSTIEKVDTSTAEKVKASNLSRELKLHLLKTRFGYD